MSFFHYPYTHTHTHTHIFLFQEAFKHNHLRCYPSKDRLIRSKRITLLLVEDPCPPLSRGYVKPEGSCVLSHWPALKAGLCVAHWIESVPSVMWALRCEREHPLSSRGAGWVKPPSSIPGSRLPGKQCWGWACWAPGTQGRALLPSGREDVRDKGDRVIMAEEGQQFK